MTEMTSWDEVGRRFADLGRRIESTWSQGRPDEKARAELDDATDRIKAAMDEMADTITRAVGSPDVRDATKHATSGVAEALASSLHQVADWIDRKPTTDKDRSDKG